jgi:glycosyltransferase involved in cell wall biosynthesis
MPDYAVVIPVFNEQIKLENVLLRCAAAGVGNLVVVDDGSTDQSVVVARKHGATVIQLSQSRLGVARGHLPCQRDGCSLLCDHGGQ